MDFILTTYIYPIKEPIEISLKMNFSLDNPRTDEEIRIVLAHIEKSLNSPDEIYKDDPHFRIPIHLTDETEEILNIESSLIEFKTVYSLKDEYVAEFLTINEGKSILDKIARMWIIARFDDEGEHEIMKNYMKELGDNETPGFFMLEKGNPIIDNSENLISYCYLLSLLIHTDEEYYHGESFLLHHDSFSIQFPKVDRFLNQVIMQFAFNCYRKEEHIKEDRWRNFYYIREDLVNCSKDLNEIIDDNNKDKILFISNLLKVIGHDIKDERYRLVTLVSIIELLLTHNPDNSRFNVEDSISKQFRLKTSIIVYQNDKTRDLNWIKGRLKDLYNQRSNIAHGNFKSLNDYLKTEAKKSKDDDIDENIILELLSRDSYIFIRAILEEYIKDRELIEFIKSN